MWLEVTSYEVSEAGAWCSLHYFAHRSDLEGSRGPVRAPGVENSSLILDSDFDPARGPLS